ncbi:sodium-translocating pyrophosphatase [Candidatus Poribacteria bacterium]|nr:sodium-translocating pyrophosphatase [Candidatus Poribacteria bacterium]MBT5535635.1 sodium-translocating pyrophosphatase [Candidatus Poribacteria bacterium]MBT7101517.1 sodium-translocating pyrophosphatase [Candidatus Poribacteria bacterium]
MPMIWWIAPIGSLVALVFAVIFYRSVVSKDEGTPEMIEIAQAVREGAMAYLKRQYKVVSVIFAVLFVVFLVMAFGLKAQNTVVPFAFLTGGLFSGLCGFFGMKTATQASARTTHAARASLNGGLQVAFRAGAVMGLVVVGFALLDITGWFLALYYLFPASFFSGNPLPQITVIMLSFGMGASTQALFARVGGGIYTKAADVGADIVGKVEAGLPEDDPRNAATIADNVGDNVGDVAGMGADLYESYAGSILATAALGVAAVSVQARKAPAFLGGLTEMQMQLKYLAAPMVLAGIGIFISILGVYSVRAAENASMRSLLNALSRSINLSSIAIAAAAIGVLHLLGLPDMWNVWGAIVVGLVAGIIIGKATEYYTSHEYKPTQKLAEQALTGAGTTIIDGIAVGMMSTGIPVVTIVIAIILSYYLPGGGQSPLLGLYGIGIAAVGMLSTLGLTLATDAYGPIADNAGGNAEMAGLPPEVRQRTDQLDALGNTTAATGKGFAIGSAALTAMALLAAYIEEIRYGLMHLAHITVLDIETFTGEIVQVPIAEASIADFMAYYDVTLMNPNVLVGLFLGSVMAFFFCALTMKAVGRAAGAMVDEVRRQIREIPGIMEGETKPDYARCVEISTVGAQREMVLPSLLAIAAPILVGILFSVPGVLGLLAGGLAAGFVLAVMMANAGGAWDNAKKYIEEGHHGGKGSEAHKAAVVGDTVGDPFKDTSGPSLNILIKLMAMVSIVFAGFIAKYAGTAGILESLLGG